MYRFTLTDITMSRCNYQRDFERLDLAISAALEYAEFLIDISPEYYFTIKISGYLSDVEKYVTISTMTFRGCHV